MHDPRSTIRDPRSPLPLIGCHLSAAGGLANAPLRAREIGATTFQFFTSNPRGWEATPLDPEDVARFRELTGDGRDDRPFPVAHMPYLPNLAAPNDRIHRLSVRTLIRELERCEALGVAWLVTHLGSHLGEGEEFGRERIAGAVNEALAAAESSALLVLENTAGTRNSLGTTPADLARLIEKLNQPGRIGICIDTAHAFAAGYDWQAKRNRLALELKAAGIVDRVKLLHLNDSKVRLAGHADRHEHLGLGEIGLPGLKRAVNLPIFRKLPLICETPLDDRRGDEENVAMAWQMRGRRPARPRKT